MKKIELKYRKWLRTVFGTISLTAVAFVFQACYGPGPDMFYDVKLTGTVMSKNTHLPIKGIKITVNDEQYNYGMTDENGNFNFYASVPNRDYIGDNRTPYTADSVRVHFLDIDGIENGDFVDKIVIIDPNHNDEVKIHVLLDEKQSM
jgi:hypothetical protein